MMNLQWKEVINGTLSAKMRLFVFVCVKTNRTTTTKSCKIINYECSVRNFFSLIIK